MSMCRSAHQASRALRRTSRSSGEKDEFTSKDTVYPPHSGKSEEDSRSIGARKRVIDMSEHTRI
jgi:hypothetical protein